MANTPLKPYNIEDDIVDIKRQSLYARLKRLFSTDTVVRNIGGKKIKRKDTDSIQYAVDKNSLRDRFNRIRSTNYNAYTRDFSLSYQAARMDLFRDYDCIGPDTIIPLPDGTYPTIKELTEKYKDKPQERFYVYSYDHKTGSIKLGKAYHPRKKGSRIGFKVTFDNGEYVIGSEKHPFLMRNGEYKIIKDLKIGDSVMPFYQKDFYGEGYRSLYNFSKGWQSEHVIVAEQFYRPLNENEVVHHKNFKKGHNLPDNLQIMLDSEHKAYHMKLNNEVIWSPEDKPKTLEKIKNSIGYKNRKFHKWNGKRKGENNPFFGKLHSVESNDKRSETLKEVFKDRNYIGGNNPNFREDLTIEVLKVKASEYYKNNGKLDVWGFCEFVGCDYSTVYRRLHSNKFHWIKFKNEVISTLNHKIVSIECIGGIDVYDVTVEKYQNFATDSCFVHNTMDMDPIIASALDIYADECLHGDTKISLLNGEKKTIKELYNENFKNFWVYSLDENGNFIPKKCERIAYNGQKSMVKITLDDGTEIKCTKNHQWVKSDNSLTFTENLKVGDSLKVIKSKLSDNKFLNGYEMLLENGKWKYTHRIVANTIDCLVQQKNNLISDYKVIHHNSFNKRNNDPDCLEWMDYKAHRLVHSMFNKMLWSDPSKTHIYKEKIRDAHKKYWTEERRNFVASRQKRFMESFVVNLSDDEKKSMYGLRGSKNGMFNNGSKLEKEKNGRWYKNVGRIDTISIEDYEKDIQLGISKKQLRTKYNIARLDQQKLHKLLCKKYNVTRMDQVKYKILGYNSYSDYKKSNNHRIVSIEDCGLHDAYDLVNVGDFHIYGIECNDGSKLFTHNCTTRNEVGKVLTINSKNNNIKEILDNLFYDVLNIDFNLWSWIRNMCKYGDLFLKLYITPEYGVYLVEPISSYNVERIENADPYNKRYVKFQIRPTDTSQSEVVENHEMAHFRLLSDSNFLPYGKSVIEGGRRVWKQLSLMEDAMLIHRIMRAPERRIFSIDVGNIPPNEVDNYIEKVNQKLKKVPYIDPNTGEYNLRFNLQNMVEDYVIAVRGGDSGTKIDTLSGMEFTGIDDIEYLRNKLMAALKIPKAFLGYEEGLSGKATLASEDVRFGRTIQRVQRMVETELGKIAVIHLYAQGYKDESLVDFELELTNPSTIFEQEKVSIWSDKIAVAADMMEAKLFSRKWIYKNLFNLSDDDAETEQNNVVDDSKQNFRFTSIEEEGNDPAKPQKQLNPAGVEAGGSPGGGLGGELGGLGGPELGGSGGPGGPELGGPGGPGGPGSLPGGLKESEERDQEGEKDAKDYPFGEDPLGDKELTEKPNKNSERKRKSPIQHNFEGGSPLGLNETKKPKKFVDKNVISSLQNFLQRTVLDEKKELLEESQHSGSNGKSLLDESNILEE